MPITVLVYAGEEEFGQQVTSRLSAAGLTAHAETDADEAARFLADEGAAVILFVASDSNEQDLAAIRRFKNTKPDADIILLEREGNVDFVLEARKQGVLDNVLVPFDLAKLLSMINDAGSDAS